MPYAQSLELVRSNNIINKSKSSHRFPSYRNIVLSISLCTLILAHSHTRRGKSRTTTIKMNSFKWNTVHSYYSIYHLSLHRQQYKKKHIYTSAHTQRGLYALSIIIIILEWKHTHTKNCLIQVINGFICDSMRPKLRTKENNNNKKLYQSCVCESPSFLLVVFCVCASFIDNACTVWKKKNYCCIDIISSNSLINLVRVHNFFSFSSILFECTKSWRIDRQPHTHQASESNACATHAWNIIWLLALSLANYCISDYLNMFNSSMRPKLFGIQFTSSIFRFN